MDHFKKYFLLTFLFNFSFFFISCKQNYRTEIKITTEKTDSVNIGLAGSWGNAIIFWGDDSKEKNSDLWSLPIYFNKNYSTENIHTITIYGTEIKTITGLYCYNNGITKIDVSNNPKLNYLEVLRNNITDLNIKENTELINLDCTWNKLKTLDVSNNKNLGNLSCENNQLTKLNLINNTKLSSVFLRSNKLNSIELDSLFESLHNNKISGKTIYIGGNPGVRTANIDIAKKKGWIVDTITVQFK